MEDQPAEVPEAIPDDKLEVDEPGDGYVEQNTHSLGFETQEHVVATPVEFPPEPERVPEPEVGPVAEPASANGTEGAEPGTHGTGAEETGQEPKRRRRKWGPPAADAVVAPEGGGSGEGTTAASASTPTPPPEGLTGDGDGSEADRKRRRRSRWEENEGAAAPAASTALAVVPAVTGAGAMVAVFPKEVVLSGGIKVHLPTTITGETTMSNVDPRIRTLTDELETLNKRLQNNELDIPPEGDPRRSPSPEPIYDRNGIRQNTREIRYRERLLDNRNRVVEELMKEDPTFKPPADYRPKKYWKKVYIPQDAFPTYNFIGLIIGPRGNTQKRMQKETNTKIAIRGRGSVKEGASRDPKYDYGEDEELHVLITGERQDDVDKAVEMIERLLEPNDDTLNEHKRLQLRELAALNGTLKDEVACYICGETTHRSTECPKSQAVEIYKLPDEIRAKAEEQYARDVARMQGDASGGRGLEDEYKSFLRELGGAPPPEMMGDLAALEARESGARPGLGRPRRPGDDLPEDHKLYIAGLPPVFNDVMLKSMFEPFGNVLYAVVATDGAGNSRGFGFVHMPEAAMAKAAKDGMDGRMIEGKPLTVRLRSERNELRQRGTGGTATGGVEGVDDACKLYLGQLPSTTSEQLLRPLFEPFGPILELRLIRDRETGGLKGFGFLTMTTPAAAAAVMRAMHGYRIDGKMIVVKQAGAPPGSGKEEHSRDFSRDHNRDFHRDIRDYSRQGGKPDGPGRMMGPMTPGGPPMPPGGHYPPGPVPPPGGPPPPPHGGPYPPPGPYPPSGPPPPYPPPHPHGAPYPHPGGHYSHPPYGGPYGTPGAPPPPPYGPGAPPPPPYGAPPPGPAPAPGGAPYHPYGVPMPPELAYGAAPPPYGAPPQQPYGYATAPGGYPPDYSAAGYTAPAPPPPPSYPPPLPPSQPPPPPPESAPGGADAQPPLPPSSANDMQQLSEYERFMAEMQRNYA
ncbi:hypothetical protein VaNZ11_006024 [Volvox africanus]|uniref:Branchpoint-bridging protein n=1 Tax=Volvox africanus TaxID=51714 RepID=A0ABQ5S079_9CHLO|nr:hypothetical protein VaNZ11_006024 [Volvox africanus]